eukprot:1161079-Pelagomonas_calceolata.AAC.15
MKIVIVETFFSRAEPGIIIADDLWLGEGGLLCTRDKSARSIVANQPFGGASAQSSLCQRRRPHCPACQQPPAVNTAMQHDVGKSALYQARSGGNKIKAGNEQGQ